MHIIPMSSHGVSVPGVLVPKCNLGIIYLCMRKESHTFFNKLGMLKTDSNSMSSC